MTLLLRAEDVIGLPVVSIASGDDVAEVRDVVYEADRRRLVGFTLNRRGALAGRSKCLLPAADVAGLGPHAVLIADDDDLRGAREVPDELSDRRQAVDVGGDRVVTEDGVDLGEVTGVILLVDGSGRDVTVAGFELDGARFVPAALARATSGDALVVPADTAGLVRDDMAGFAAAVDRFRDRVGGDPWSSG